MPITDSDRLIISAAIRRGGDVWNDPTLEYIKQKVKDHYLGPTNSSCCYCREPFLAVHRMTIDIEHILPKSKFSAFMFDLFNLNLSCKRCNMSIKRDRIDFLVNEATIHQCAQQSNQYNFIHPNLDSYNEHMGHISIDINSYRLVKYIPKKPKGDFTYNFFRLQEKEINTISKAQGLNEEETELLLPGLPYDIQQAAEALIERL